MNYSNKGYAPLNESKKSKDTQILFLSARAETTSKSSNSMFFFEEAAKKAGLKMVTIDPSSSSISTISDDKHKIVENGTEKKTLEISPYNTICITRRTCIKNSESRDFVRELEKLGYVMVNSLDCIDACEDKFITYKKLKDAGVPTPKTTVVTSSSLNKLQEKVDSIGGSFPIIGKILNGTQGVGVMIFDSMMSLRSCLQTMFKLSPKSDIILQEKINSEYDLRVHVLYKSFERMTPGIDNFEIIGCMRRNLLDGDFRSNYSLGSTAEKGTLTPEQEKIAKQAAKAVNARWCGVDLIMDSRTKQSYVIEVNSSPGTKGVTTVAQEDVVGTLMDMFKDFKYTKYDSDQIGRYETVTLKNLNDGVDVPMKFDDNKSFTELQCSSVNAKEDDVTFVFNGVTYTMELSGMRKGDPMVELNIRFNGTVYKNELVVLKTVNDNINKNIAVGGSKFLHRISDKAVVVEDSFILTDNTTNFEIPVEKLNESVEVKNKKDDELLDLKGLKKLFTRFINGSQTVYEYEDWKIKSDDGRDNWTLKFRGNEIVECKENYSTFISNYLTFEKACKVAGVIESFYGHEVDLSKYDK